MKVFQFVCDFLAASQQGGEKYLIRSLLTRTVHTAIVIALVFSFAACSDNNGPAAPGQKDPPEFTNADGINGGQMYDKFWLSETGWNQNDPNLGTYNAFSDFFRCKQCHGWDRLGSQGAYVGRAPSTSRPNVSGLDLRGLAAGKTPQQLFNAMMATVNRRSISEDLSSYDPNTNPTVGDQMPNYSEIFSAGQMWEIVKFLKTEAIDVSLLYDSQVTGTYPTGSIVFSNIGKDGSASNGDVLFAETCVICHGVDGAAIPVDGSFTVGSFVRSKANEAQHKIKFGQLGTGMINLGLSFDDIKDVYKAMANATKYPSPGSQNPPELEAADETRGGRLYDEFWTSDAGWNQGDPNISTFNSFSNFFRCKQCHGWDQLGNKGAYISRGPSTTRPNVSGLDLKQMVTNMTPQELFDAMKIQAGRRPVSADLSTYDPVTNSTVGDQMPDYTTIMTDTDIWDLVKFLKYDAYDTDLLYASSTTGTYPSGSITFSNIGKDGNAASGRTIFAGTCAGCHGANGTLIIVDGSFSVGSFIRAKPNEAHHKFRYGVAGTSMKNLGLSFDDIKDLYKALADPSAFPNPSTLASR